jgi:ABC-2 type transport system ATP-binding protein
MGQNETLVLTVAETDDPQILADKLKTVSGVLKADVIDHTVTIITPDAQGIISPTILLANQLGVKINAIDIQEPNLEAVFLHLTGRALGD